MRTIVGLGSPVSLCSCPTVLHGRRLSASSSSKARVTAWMFVGDGGFTEDRSKGLRIDPSLWYRWSRRNSAAWAAGTNSPLTPRGRAVQNHKAAPASDRKRVVWGKGVPVRVDLGGGRIIEKNTQTKKRDKRYRL